MHDQKAATLAIVDYGLGNLFSVLRACQSTGATALITHAKQEILDASGVILPGVGAFGVAIQNLATLDLIGVLRDVAASGKPLLGVCLGMQLLMEESHEFGRHKGLGLIAGDVVRLPGEATPGVVAKVPHVGWESLWPPPCSEPKGSGVQRWSNSMLQKLSRGEYMYFGHSFYCRPDTPDTILSLTRYDQFEFCSAVARANVMGCQFHPERSGPGGLEIYRTFSAMAVSGKEGGTCAGKA